MANFGSKLREFRTLVGKTQGELGKALGVPQSTISKWEKGLQRPSPQYAERLQTLIGIPIAELLGLAAQAEPATTGARGFAEMKQSEFDETLPKGSTNKVGKGANASRHPAFGVWKGKVTLLADYDYTQPADPDWGKMYED